MAAVRDAVARGEVDVVVPESAVVLCVDGGFESPVALRLRVDPGVIARRVGGSVTGRGFVRVEVPVRDVVEGVARGLGSAALPPYRWDEWPRTFDNPGFSVRYAYARASWVGRWARDLGVEPGAFVNGEPLELALVGALGDLPGRVVQARRERDARPLAFCLERVASAYHDVHERCPALPKGDERPGAVHAGRAGLAEAVRIAIGDGLKLIGETPRERI